MRIMKNLDKILAILEDTRWHSFDEIKKTISLPSDTLNQLLCFLHKLAFINIQNEMLKITNLGLKFAEL
jgi:predicted transcriptional regulator